MIYVVIMLLAMIGTAAAETPKIDPNGNVEIAGQVVSCQNVNIQLDPKLDNLGASSQEGKIIIINPDLLEHEFGVVQLFVFAHECGHILQGASETGSDAWAVRKGITDGWLTRKTMVWVCRSFGDGPATGPYPSGKRRCALAQAAYAREIKMKRERDHAIRRPE